MRILIQRVSEAFVQVDGDVKGSIQQGLVVLVGIETDDTKNDIDWLVRKLIALRIFSDSEGKMNQSIVAVKGDFLIISQFTLHASTKKGNRPSYLKAARPEIAIPLYEAFIKEIEQQLGRKVQTGQFGADMKVQLINDGPVTIWIDSKHRE